MVVNLGFDLYHGFSIHEIILKYQTSALSTRSTRSYILFKRISYMCMQIAVTAACGVDDRCPCVNDPLKNRAFHLAPKKCDGQPQ